MRFVDPNVSSTIDKLHEAKYFLDRMKEHQTDGVVFRYNLSAFVSAARSITLLMKKEFQARAGFTQWYEPKCEDMKADPMMKDLNNRRRTAIHIKTIAFGPRVHLDVRMVPVGSTEHGEALVKYYFDNLPYPHEDVFSMCQYQIDYLERLVRECVSLFGQQTNT
ncbi:MAG: hypothetical protein HY665_07035 [Chloroflexi bacterium]|nr:hypothetical protein [Chloroflexota bacterium]